MEAGFHPKGNTESLMGLAGACCILRQSLVDGWETRLEAGRLDWRQRPAMRLPSSSMGMVMAWIRMVIRMKGDVTESRDSELGQRLDIVVREQ